MKQFILNVDYTDGVGESVHRFLNGLCKIQRESFLKDANKVLLNKRKIRSGVSILEECHYQFPELPQVKYPTISSYTKEPPTA